MSQERLNGFVMAQDSVHGKPMWKVRVKQENHPLDGKKCRVMSVHGDYQPEQGHTVDFVVTSTMDHGQTVYLAYDVRPAVAESKALPEAPKVSTPETMDWFLVEQNGKISAYSLGYSTLEEAQKFYEEEGSGEKVVGFVPFNIREHVEKFDDPDVVDAFRIIDALGATDATLVGLEKLVTAIVQEAIKVSKK